MTDTPARYATPEPFTIDVPERALVDLDERLRRWKPPVAVDGGGWTYGANAEFMRELVDHWRHAYDWRRCEERFNAYPNYLVDVGPQRLHVIREPGTIVDGAPAPVPLLITHGWPGSLVEFLELIDTLAHPERHGGDALDAFDVVAPSLPGYGWSGPPVRADGTVGPIGPRAVAGLWSRLMRESFNYQRPYGAQGGDWGASISSWVAHDDPVGVDGRGAERGCFGLHLNMMVGRFGPDPRAISDLSPEETGWLQAARADVRAKNAYQFVQNQTPQSLAYGLTDSPVGLAAWIVEKFHSWADLTGSDGDVGKRFGFDTLIDNAMVYWLTGSMGTATWLYRGAAEEASGRRVALTIDTPTAFAAFPQDLAPPPPESWVRRAYNLRRYTTMPRGGHFAALEEPDLLVEDIRSFFRPLRYRAAND